MKNMYNKISPLGAKIARIVMLVSFVLLVAAWILVENMTDPWGIYYATLVKYYMIRVVIAAVVLLLLFSWSVVKEALRKFVVSLKRNPSVIPLVMLFVSFLYYSLNLTHVSNTTALIQGKGMGLCEFCIMLLNLLSLVCMLNAFPRRKKANVPMVVLMFVMFGVLIYADMHYLNGISAALNRAESPIKLDVGTAYIAKAFNMLSTYQIMIYVTAGLVALLPVYSKLLRKIKTSIEVEDNGNMAEIEIGE